MLSLEDDRWSCLTGAYGVAYDPRPLLLRLQSGRNVDGVWRELWENLHHQGDVGVASYAAVPYFVDIYRASGIFDWNVFGIVATVELARDSKRNPPVPEWLKESYFRAIEELARIGGVEIMRSKRKAYEERAILGVLAIAKGLRTHALILVDYSDEELRELLAAGESQ
jgi:hypothetical protein